MTRKVYRFFAVGLRQEEIRERIYRILGITSLLVAIGGSVVLMVAFYLRLQVLVVALSGVLSMTLAFYLFIKLWPTDDAQEGDVVDRRVQRVKTAIRAQKASPKLTPEEYRRQKQRAQQMIAKKAAPALAKAIRGILYREREAASKR